MAASSASTSFGASWGGLIASGVANTISAFGSFGLQKTKNAIAQSQANIARINAQTMMRQYEATLRASEKDIQKTTMAAGRVKGSQRAALAANGIAVGEGSAAELQASTDIVKEIDVNQIKSNALNNAWGYRMQAAGFEGQALMAEASKQSAWLTAGATLMGASQYSAANYMQAALGVYQGLSSNPLSTDKNFSAGGKWTNYAGEKQYGYGFGDTGWGNFAGASRYGRM